MSDLGLQLVDALAVKDFDRIRDLLHPEIDFRGMTPGRFWEGDVIEALRVWFDDDDVVEGVEAVETDAFADRERVGYRLRVRNGEGLHVVDEQAYLAEREGRIGWLRMMCAGYRPIDG